MTIRDFRQLQELELVFCWRSSLQKVLSSITSTELRKVTFLVRQARDWGVFTRLTREWVLIDEQLCGLVDRLCVTGYRHTLEVELRFTDIWGDFGEYDFTKVLPEFREKGVVTIIDTAQNDRVLHRSARSSH